jgi:hypothetical protein
LRFQMRRDLFADRHDGETAAEGTKVQVRVSEEPGKPNQTRHRVDAEIGKLDPSV